MKMRLETAQRCDAGQLAGAFSTYRGLQVERRRGFQVELCRDRPVQFSIQAEAHRPAQSIRKTATGQIRREYLK